MICFFSIVDFYVVFLLRAHSPERPPIDSNPLPTVYETIALTNAPPRTIRLKFVLVLANAPLVMYFNDRVYQISKFFCGF